MLCSPHALKSDGFAGHSGRGFPLPTKSGKPKLPNEQLKEMRKEANTKKNKKAMEDKAWKVVETKLRTAEREKDLEAQEIKAREADLAALAVAGLSAVEIAA